MKKIVTLLLFILLWQAPQQAHGEETIINFPDPAFEKMVRVFIDKPSGPIYKRDVETLTYLTDYYTNPGKITNFEGIQYFTSLEELQLGYHELSDISSLKHATELKKLTIKTKSTNFTSLNGIEELKQLQELSVVAPKLRALTDFRSLTMLKSLAVIAPVEDITGLGTSLEILEIAGHKITDFTPLSKLGNLKELNLFNGSGAKLDLTPVGELKKLTTLRISGNNVTNLKVLSQLSNLQTLELKDSQLTDITGLSGVKSIQSLYLSKNNISNLSPLSTLQKLDVVDLENNQIKNLNPLRNLPELSVLFLKHNQVTELEALKHLPNLQVVSLTDNPLKSREAMDVIRFLEGKNVRVGYDLFRPSTNISLFVNQKEVYVNWNKLVLSDAPYLKNQRTLVPLRFISETLGATVHWDPESKTVTIHYGGKKIELQEGSRTVRLNGKATTIDVAPEIKNGRTFVPLRFISENLGARVDYWPSNQQITITH
ncbi:stalk domain-containing protein [Anaerobacillus alkaliphilus]|nr:stalk domain-containing protein [Anaerobacillus alkaliphilus]